jgi:hypothetical protein
VLDKALRDLLYEECKGCDKEYTMLWMTLELLKLKTSNGWSHTSFLTVLELLTKVLPKPNDLPSSTYRAKKIICPLTLGIKKFMLAQTIASYKEKIMNSKINIQCAMLVGTKRMITMRRLRMIPTKRAIKSKDERERMSLLFRTLKVLKRDKSSHPCDVVPIYDQLFEAFVLQPEGC